MDHDPAAPPAATAGLPPLVMLHGFTQNGRCLGPVAEALGEQRVVLLPDLPGHGDSRARATCSVPEAAAQLVADLSPGHPGRLDWFGYSMGGRVALHVALEHPHRVRSLVLLGATAGIEDPLERSERRAEDERRAARIEEVGVPGFCREWLAAPMFESLPEWARFEAERTANSAEGLASSLRNAGTATMEPVWDRIGSLQVPVLCLAGADDPRFSALAERMAQRMGPGARCRLVEGAGHAAHLERPGATAAAVSAFLDDISR